MTVHRSEENRGSLAWAVRDSFLRYVTVIAAGTCEMDGVTVDSRNQFVFPLVQAARKGDDWHLWFTGSVKFTAHQGFLSVAIDRPELTMGPAGGLLSTNTPDGLLHLAEIAALEPVLEGDSIAWEGAQARLLESAVPMFGEVYQAGTEMSSISCSATLLRS